MNYQDRVQKKAEEFARVEWDGTFDKMSPDEQKSRIEDMLPLAEKAVRDEGEAYRQGAERVCELAGIRTVDASIGLILSELGYLKTEEHG